MECNDNTEIVVHDNGKRLASLMYYEGETIDKITIGRDMGWGALSSVVMNGNVSIGTSTQNTLLTLYGTTQLQPKISLTGIEYYSGTNTNGDKIGLFLGANRTDNRQLWICDTARTAINATNATITFSICPTTPYINCLGTDGTKRKTLNIGDAFIANSTTHGSINKILKIHNIQVADDVPTMNNLIYNEGAFAGGVFADDNFISSYWGMSILMNSGGNAANSGSNGRSYDAGYSSFTVNVRTSSTSTTFDKRLFTIRQNGQMIMYNDVWHLSYDGAYRFYFAGGGGTTFLAGGNTNSSGICTQFMSGTVSGFAVPL
jgi:hypothetical protein